MMMPMMIGKGCMFDSKEAKEMAKLVRKMHEKMGVPYMPMMMNGMMGYKKDKKKKK